MADAFESLHRFLSEAYKTTQEIRFPYWKEYGWCITHKKGKNLFVMFLQSKCIYSNGTIK